MANVLWLVRSDEKGQPILPTERYGPVLPVQRMDWKGFNCNDFTSNRVNEIQFPSFGKWRNPGWNIHGVRPPRAIPRAIDIELKTASTTVGSRPGGVFDELYHCSDESAGRDSELAANYVGSNASGTTASFALSSATNWSGPTSRDPLIFRPIDHVLSWRPILNTASKVFWTILPGPETYDGETLLADTPAAALVLFEKTPYDGAQRRTLWLNPDVEGTQPCTVERNWFGSWEAPYDNVPIINQRRDLVTEFRFEWTWTDAWIGDAGIFYWLNLLPFGGSNRIQVQWGGFSPGAETIQFILTGTDLIHVTDALAGEVYFRFFPELNETWRVQMWIPPDFLAGEDQLLFWDQCDIAPFYNSLLPLENTPLRAVIVRPVLSV